MKNICIYIFLFNINIFASKNDPHCKYWGDYSYGSVAAPSWGANTYYSVGKFCSIAGVKIFLGGNHRTDWISTFPFPAFTDKFPEAAGITDFAATKGNVIIGNDVWIGADVLILSGVTIGDGAVIGANSVVTKDVPPYAIVAGNPARIKKYRFDQSIINELLKIKWWDWPIQKIRNNSRLLSSQNIKEFINTHNK